MGLPPQSGLFGDSEVTPDASVRPATTDAAAPPRLRRPERAQVLLRPCALDDLVED